jgi:hypothetical protein
MVFCINKTNKFFASAQRVISTFSLRLSAAGASFLLSKQAAWISSASILCPHRGRHAEPTVAGGHSAA